MNLASLSFAMTWLPFRTPSVFLAATGESKNARNNFFCRIANAIVDICLRQICHNAIVDALLNRRHFRPRLAGGNKLVQQYSEHRCVGGKEGENPFVRVGHSSVSVGCFDPSNEERAPTESQGSVGACAHRSQDRAGS